MMPSIHLSTLLGGTGSDPADRLRLFAMVSLGVVESLAAQLLLPDDAIRLYFHAENCLFVRHQLGDKRANMIMGRGVQLQDLFEALPADEARSAFLRQIKSLRDACLDLLARRQAAA